MLNGGVLLFREIDATDLAQPTPRRQDRCQCAGLPSTADALLFRTHLRNDGCEPSFHPFPVYPNDKFADRRAISVLPLDLETEVAASNHPFLRLGLRPNTNSSERRQPHHTENDTCANTHRHLTQKEVATPRRNTGSSW
jgi:hypothetical protein